MTESERVWIYAVGNERRGPVSAGELGLLISSGRLLASTLVWRPGMAEWHEAGHVTEIAALCAPPVPKATRAEPSAPPKATPTRERTAPQKQPAAEKKVDQSDTFLGGTHHPWRRFFARLMDLWTLGVLVAFVLGRVTSADSVTVLDNPFVRAVLSVLASIWPEAFFISFFGATPGKWLFGISVRHGDGRNLTFVEAAQRAILVNLQGMGLGIPFLSTVTLYFGYRRLTTTGTTLWDDWSGSVVSQQKWTPLGWILVALGTIGWAFLVVILQNLATGMDRRPQISAAEAASASPSPISSPLPTSQMGWQLTNGCRDAGINLRLFDRTNNLVWPPDATTTYVVRAGEAFSLTITCRTGAAICLGAETMPATAKVLSWGAGIAGTTPCETCCRTCSETDGLPSSRLNCEVPR